MREVFSCGCTELLPELDRKRCILAFRPLPEKVSSEVFSDLDSGHKDELMEVLTDEEIAQLLAGLQPDARTCFLAELPDQPVESLMDRSFVAVSALKDREKAAHLLQHYRLDALPVVDRDGPLLGIVTFDDVLGISQEEATEDFQKIGAAAPLETRHRDATVPSLYHKRIVWLAPLLGVNLITAAIISADKHIIVACVVLASFIPLMTASGGNAGVLPSTLVIRAVGTGELPLEKWFWILAREVGVGAMLALTTRLQAESAPGKSREATPENNRIPSWVILGFPDFVTAWMRASGNGFSQCLRQEASDMLLDNLPRDLSDLVFSSVTFFAAIRDYRLFEDPHHFLFAVRNKSNDRVFRKTGGLCLPGGYDQTDVAKPQISAVAYALRFPDNGGFVSA